MRLWSEDNGPFWHWDNLLLYPLAGLALVVAVMVVGWSGVL